MAYLKESIVGFIIGVLPGAGGTIAAMMAYSNEKRLSKEPESFGTGVPEGLAALKLPTMQLLSGQ